MTRIAVERTPDASRGARLLRIAAPVLVLGLVSPAASEPAPLLDGPYILDAEVSFHRALLHWIDSLTGVAGPGMTAGKTWNAHREEYSTRLGPPGADDVRWLERYLHARGADVAGSEGDQLRLTGAFYEAPDLDTAIERAGALLAAGHRTDFTGAVRHFAAKYETVWNDGAEAARFLGRVREDRGRMRRLSRFLAGVAKFYGVDAKRNPATLVLAPVQHGHGTHAQAIGRFLLVEVRPGEGLRDQVAPIVHENAHFLYLLRPASRRAEMAAIADASGEHGPTAWALLQEALPTAIAQGVADSRLGAPGWSMRRPWYDVEQVDAYAKRIYPIVRRALERGTELDRKLLAELLAAYEPISGS